MPELPEVETIKEALKKSVEGSRIVSVTINNRNFRKKIPDDFEQTILKAKIISVRRWAKYAILDLDNGYSIIWHFGMSGRVKIIAKNQKLELQKHDHIIIETTDSTLVFNDARRFGLIIYEETKNLKNCSLFKNLGPEPFDLNFTADYLFKKFKSKNIAIKIALLDQAIVTGIGNIYASEALYDAHISPIRRCNDLKITELEHLILSIKETLKKAIKAGGSTLRDYRQPDGSMGYFQFQHCVYGKEGLPCPHCTCTKGIKKIVQGGRSTFYCEKLQK